MASSLFLGLVVVLKEPGINEIEQRKLGDTERRTIHPLVVHAGGVARRRDDDVVFAVTDQLAIGELAIDRRRHHLAAYESKRGRS